MLWPNVAGKVTPGLHSDASLGLDERRGRWGRPFETQHRKGTREERLDLVKCWSEKLVTEAVEYDSGKAGGIRSRRRSVQGLLSSPAAQSLRVLSVCTGSTEDTGFVKINLPSVEEIDKKMTLLFSSESECNCFNEERVKETGMAFSFTFQDT